MLEAVQSHCMARLNGSHVVLVGGEPLLSPDTKRGFLFDLTTEEWTELPEMGTARCASGKQLILSDSLTNAHLT